MVEELSQEQRKEFKEAFNIFDSNGGGTISHGELGTVMRSLGQNPTEKDLEDMIKEVDQDGNGEIDFEEFLLLMVKTMNKADDDDELKRAFRIFDVDNSGAISGSELKLIMECLGEKLTDEEVKTMIEIADDDRDGEVNLNEFIHILKKQQ